MDGRVSELDPPLLAASGHGWIKSLSPPERVQLTFQFLRWLRLQALVVALQWRGLGSQSRRSCCLDRLLLLLPPAIRSQHSLHFLNKQLLLMLNLGRLIDQMPGELDLGLLQFPENAFHFGFDLPAALGVEQDLLLPLILLALLPDLEHPVCELLLLLLRSDMLFQLPPFDLFIRHLLRQQFRLRRLRHKARILIGFERLVNLELDHTLRPIFNLRCQLPPSLDKYISHLEELILAQTARTVATPTAIRTQPIRVDPHSVELLVIIIMQTHSTVIPFALELPHFIPATTTASVATSLLF